MLSHQPCALHTSYRVETEDERGLSHIRHQSMSLHLWRAALSAWHQSGSKLAAAPVLWSHAALEPSGRGTARLLSSTSKQHDLAAPVLISGAGPSGLTLALLLSRYGE
eukprot:1141480-Pelagomonas_calceolata.AAC.2